MPSRRHQLQQLTAARRRQQQQLQTNADLGKFPSVFPRPYGRQHSRRPIRHDTNGERNETNHGSRGAAMIRLGRWEFMVAVVDGRRRWRLVYVRYRLYYSYVILRRIYFFRLADGGSRSRTQKNKVRLTRNPVNLKSPCLRGVQRHVLGL